MKKIILSCFFVISLLFLVTVFNTPKISRAVVVCDDSIPITFPGCSYTRENICDYTVTPPVCSIHNNYFCTTITQTVLCLRETCVAANAYGTSCYCDGSHCGLDKFCNVDTGAVSCESQDVVSCGDNTCDYPQETCASCSTDCGVCTTPPPASCPNGTCGSGENCANCAADCGVCPTPTADPCGGASPPAWCTPKPGSPMIVYLDANNNGVWDYNSGEVRVTPNSCSSPYTQTLGIGLTVTDHVNTEDWNCNSGSDVSGVGCTGGHQSCGGHNCGEQAGDNIDEVYNSCLGSKTCANSASCRCNPPYVGCPGEHCPGGSDTTQGSLCRQNGDFCNDASAGSLRDGPYFKSHARVGWHTTTLTLPPGWTMSNLDKAKIGSATNFSCSPDGLTCSGSVNFATNGTASGGWACMSLISLGIKRNPLPAPNNLLTSCSTNTSQVTFSWDNVTGADGYIVRINHDDQCYAADGVTLVPWACTATSNCNASYGYGVCADQFIATKGNPSCSVVGGRTNCLVTIRQGETYPDWSVQPILPGELYPYISPAGTGATFLCQAQGNVVGQVWEDSTGVATGGINGCVGPVTTAMNSVNLTLFNSLGANFGTKTTSSGVVTFTNVPYGPPTNPTNTMILDTATLPAGYTLTCPSSGTMQISTVPNTSSPARFFATLMRDAWFQLRNGNARSESGANPAIKSIVPTSCTAPGCNPYLFAMNGATVATDGYAVTGVGGMLSTSETAGTPLANIRETDKVYAQSGRTAIKEGYDYFYRQFSMGTNPQADFTDAEKADLQLAPILANGALPRDGRKAYYANSAVTINQAMNVSSGQKVTIFVNSDLNIKNTVRVAQGGFLAFIVRGNVNIDATVGSADPTSTTSVVEGIFIADGVLRTCTNHNDSCGNTAQNISDLKFVGAGTFVGWTGLTLQRDFSDSALGGIANNRNPAELFYSRPDFMLYTPEEMKKPHYLWQEVNP